MSPFQGPSSAVSPGLREPFGGPGPGFFAWGDFNLYDLENCYPMPTWVRQRLASRPQRSVGNALRDPLPVPFARDEVKRALREIHLKRKTHIDRNCTPVDAASVRIALQVLPIIESRNGGWIDFDAGRPLSEPPLNVPQGQRRNVFNLRCLLYRLPGKPLPPLYRGPCFAAQPRRLAALYNIRDVSTTFDLAAGLPPPGSGPGLPYGEGPYGHSPVMDRPRYPAPPMETYGIDLEAEPVPEPEPFSYALFDVFATFDIKGD